MGKGTTQVLPAETDTRVGCTREGIDGPFRSPGVVGDGCKVWWARNCPSPRKVDDLARDSYLKSSQENEQNLPLPSLSPCHFLPPCFPPSFDTMPAKNTKAPAAVASKQGPPDENVFLFIPNLIGTLTRTSSCTTHPFSTQGALDLNLARCAKPERITCF